MSTKTKEHELPDAATRGDEEVFNFLSKPHTISAMIAGGAVLVYFAFTRDEGHNSLTHNNVKAYAPLSTISFVSF